MDRLRRLLLPLLAVSFLVSAQGTAVGEGVIQGVVLGEGARPVRGAKVHAELKGVPMAKKIRYVETDENGFFLIDQLEFGTYYVAAENEEKGYGDSGFSHPGMRIGFTPTLPFDLKFYVWTRVPKFIWTYS